MVRYEKICLHKFRQNRTTLRTTKCNYSAVMLYIYLAHYAIRNSGSSCQLTWYQYTNREWGQVQGLSSTVSSPEEVVVDGDYTQIRDRYISSSLSAAIWVAKQALCKQQLPARIYIALCYFPVQLNSTSNWYHRRRCVSKLTDGILCVLQLRICAWIMPKQWNDYYSLLRIILA